MRGSGRKICSLNFSSCKSRAISARSGPSVCASVEALKSWMKFLGDRAAAHDFAALQHHGLESAFRQVIRGDQRVVTTANEHYFLSDRHGQFAAFFHSFRITWLAMRPFAPMMPPPGCVADPHI